MKPQEKRERQNTVCYCSLDAELQKPPDILRGVQKDPHSVHEKNL